MVNGPESLNKYVGASEENIRNLFKDAEADQAARGDDSGARCPRLAPLPLDFFFLHATV